MMFLGWVNHARRRCRRDAGVCTGPLQGHSARAPQAQLRALSEDRAGRRHLQPLVLLRARRGLTMAPGVVAAA